MWLFSEDTFIEAFLIKKKIVSVNEPDLGKDWNTCMTASEILPSEMLNLCLSGFFFFTNISLSLQVSLHTNPFAFIVFYM